MNNQNSEDKYIVKFRFSINKSFNKRLGEFLYLIKTKYKPSLFYIKECSEMRDIIKEENFSFNKIEKTLEFKNRFLYESFKDLLPHYKEIPNDLLSYVIIAFGISCEEIKSIL